MNIILIPSLDFMTYKLYMEQLMPMVERRINRILYRNNDIIETLDNTDLTLHMGAYEQRKDVIYESSDEGEQCFSFRMS